MKATWYLISAMLIPGCVSAQCNLDYRFIASPFLIDGNDVLTKDFAYPDRMYYWSSPFGPRDTAGSGSAFHQGLDIASPLGKVISSTTSGKITQISRRNFGTGNALYIQNGADEFGYWHLFTQGSPSTSGFILGTYKHVINAPGGPYVIPCDVIWDTKPVPKQVLMDSRCTVPAGQFVKGPSNADYRVVKSVSAGTRMAPTGNSGAGGTAHLHLAFRYGGELKNPLSRMGGSGDEGIPVRVRFCKTPSCDSDLRGYGDSGKWLTPDSGGGALVSVAGPIMDLDEIKFFVQPSGAGGGGPSSHYRFAGQRGCEELPSDIQKRSLSATRDSNDGRPAVYAFPYPYLRSDGHTSWYKELTFWVDLKDVRGKGRLSIQAYSANGSMKTFVGSIPFVIADDTCVRVDSNTITFVCGKTWRSVTPSLRPCNSFSVKSGPFRGSGTLDKQGLIPAQTQLEEWDLQHSFNPDRSSVTLKKGDTEFSWSYRYGRNFHEEFVRQSSSGSERCVFYPASGPGVVPVQNEFYHYYSCSGGSCVYSEGNGDCSLRQNVIAQLSGRFQSSDQFYEYMHWSNPGFHYQQDWCGYGGQQGPFKW